MGQMVRLLREAVTALYDLGLGIHLEERKRRRRSRE